MQFKDAAYQILQTAGTPLHYNETPSAAAKAVAQDWKAGKGWDFWKCHHPTTGALQKIASLKTP
jgi:hypothetical protein